MTDLGPRRVDPETGPVTRRGAGIGGLAMQIRNVRVSNFKCLEALDLALRSSNCIVGPNNSGKTTLLQALALFDFCKQHCLSRRRGVFELKPRSVSPEELYVLPVPRPHDLWTDRKTSGNHQQVRAGPDVNTAANH